MTSTVVGRAIVIVISALQFIGLLMQWPNVKWLSLYVPLLEACVYFAGIVVPGHGIMNLENGKWENMADHKISVNTVGNPTIVNNITSPQNHNEKPTWG